MVFVFPKAPGPFTIAATIENSTINSGDGLQVYVDLKNISDRTVNVPNGIMGPYDGDLPYDFVVLDEAGREAPRTAFGLKYGMGGSSISRRFVQLASGDTLPMAIMITKYYDLTLPGKYTVQVSPRWKVPVTRPPDPLAITVVDGPMSRPQCWPKCGLRGGG